MSLFCWTACMLSSWCGSATTCPDLLLTLRAPWTQGLADVQSLRCRLLGETTLTDEDVLVVEIGKSPL